MTDRNLKIALILSASDRMSAVVNGAVNRATAKLKSFSDAAFRNGRDMMSIGAAAGMSMYAPIKAYADLEDAGLRLKSVMMRDGGIIPEALFKKMNDQAVYLGNLLPGTTADFQNLYATMLEQGTPAAAILSGTGKAAAYLAVQLKMPTEQAGILASRLRLQMGIADEEMMKFMDIMARIKNVGVDPTEMQYAFGRSAGAMKLLNVQGLAASKTLGTLYAMLIREGGATGETAGTGISKIMNELLNPTKMAKFNVAAKAAGLSFEFFRGGKFLGMENFVAQLSKFQNMDPQRISKILQPLTGGEGMDNQFIASLSKMGVGGFNKMSMELANQATVTQKVNLQLTSLKNNWEATTGTMTNTLAAFGETFAPSLKLYSLMMSNAAVKMQAFIKEHPVFFKYAGLAVMIFATLAIGVGSVAFAFGAVARVMLIVGPAFSGIGRFITLLFNPMKLATLVVGGLSKAFMFGISIINKLALAFMYVGKALMIAGRFMMANPIILIVTAIAIAAFLIYKYWDQISAFFKKLWENIKIIFSAAWEWIKSIFQTYNPTGMIINAWKSVTGFFSKIWGFVKTVFVAALKIIGALLITFTPLGLIYHNWNKITAFFSRLWEGVKNILSLAWAGIKNLFFNYTPYGLIYTHWDKITTFFSDLWAGVKEIISSAWTGIKHIFFNYTPHGLVYTHWNKITSFFGGVWNKVKSVFLSAWTWIKATLMVFTPFGLIFTHWDKLGLYFGGVWDSVKQKFASVYDWVMSLGSKFFDAGKNIITSIGKGIKAAVNMPFDEVLKAMGKVRNLLPFSPAKAGPLRDIHRIKLIETIAGSVKSAPLMNAMKNVVMDVSRFNGKIQPVSQHSGSGAVLNFSPNIYLSGGATQSDANMLTSQMKKQFEIMMKNYFSAKERANF